MTRLFNRKDKTTIAELEEYYSSTGKKNRTGMAWVMAILSVVLTVILVVAVFFLVRWIYRSVTDDNSNTTTVTETEVSEVELPTFDGDIVGQGNQAEGSNPQNGAETGGVVSDEAASITIDNGQNSTTSGATAGTSTGSTTSSGVGGEGSDIPNTGAGEIIVLVPIVAGVAGYFISRRYLIKNN